MSPDEQLSPRAAELLAAIDAEAAERRERMAGESAGGPPEPATDPAGSSAAADFRLPPSDDGTPARLINVVQQIVRRTEEAHRRLDELSAAIDQVTHSLTARGVIQDPPPKPSLPVPPVAQPPAGGPIRPPAPPRPPAQPRPQAPPRRPPAPARRPPAPPTPPPAPPVAGPPGPAAHEGARLVAIEMAVTGASRGEVGARLKAEYGIADPRAILDDVFGAGSAASSRMPWG